MRPLLSIHAAQFNARGVPMELAWLMSAFEHRELLHQDREEMGVRANGGSGMRVAA
jgi:hypothetical protein